MKQFFLFIDQVLSSDIVRNITLYEILATIFKYIFVYMIFRFLSDLVRMIYLDIDSIGKEEPITGAYLRLLTRRESLSYKVEDFYALEGETTIGRGRQCDIRLDDRFLSKLHARIIEEDGEYYLEDLDSSNGTYLNGEEIGDALLLMDKDVIALGDSEFLFLKGGEHHHA